MKNNLLSIVNKIFFEQLSIFDIITEESKLFELGVDSIGFMILIVYLENELGIEIDVEKILDKQYDTITVGYLIEIISGVIANEETD